MYDNIFNYILYIKQNFVIHKHLFVNSVFIGILYKKGEVFLKLQAGEISNKELVNLWGTKRQKENYIKDKKLDSRVKERIMKKAQKVCKIEDLGGGKYVVHKIYNPKTKVYEAKMESLNQGLCQYLAPLILHKLLYEQDKNYKIMLPFFGWAKRFEIINENYPLVKHNQEEMARYLGISQDIIFDYFSIMDSCIKYYLDKCLAVFESNSVDLIIHTTDVMARRVSVSISDKTHLGIDIYCNYKDEALDDEEIKFVIDCEKRAWRKANLSKPQEKYYGIKSGIYWRELKRLLSKQDILFTYKVHNLFCKDKDRVKKAMQRFNSVNIFNEDKLVQAFHNAFLDYIENKAGLRQKRELNDSKKVFRLAETYVADFKCLSTVTIPKDAESLHDKLETDIKKVMELYNINIIHGGEDTESSKE